MPPERPTPYLQGKAGDLITAPRWNELQVQEREEIASSLALHEARLHGVYAMRLPSVVAEVIDAGVVTSDHVKATELAAGSLAADTVEAGALSLDTLHVTERMTLPDGIAAMAPRVYSAHFLGDSAATPFPTHLTVKNQGVHPYFGGHFNVSGSLCHWATVPPQLTLVLETAGLLQLRTNWLITNQLQGCYALAQFIIGSGGKYTPVRFEPGSRGVACGAFGWDAFPWSPPVRNPTASTFQSFLDYSWSSYNENGYRWPVAGMFFYHESNQSPAYQDAIEVPAGTYTIQVGFSGTAWVGNLQLHATFYPGGTAEP